MASKDGLAGCRSCRRTTNLKHATRDAVVCRRVGSGTPPPPAIGETNDAHGWRVPASQLLLDFVSRVLSAAGFCESASPKQGVEGTVEPVQRVRWRPHRAFPDSRSVSAGPRPRNYDACFPATPNGTDRKTSNDAPNSKSFESLSAPSTVGRAAAIDRMTGRECHTSEPFSCLSALLRSYDQVE
jgi:hypothetical protein